MEDKVSFVLKMLNYSIKKISIHDVYGSIEALSKKNRKKYLIYCRANIKDGFLKSDQFVSTMKYCSLHKYSLVIVSKSYPSNYDKYIYEEGKVLFSEKWRLIPYNKVSEILKYVLI